MGISCNPKTSPPTRRPDVLPFRERSAGTQEVDKKLKDIMKISGKLKINDVTYNTDIKEMEYIEELGHGTCGQVMKMRHGPSGEIIAVKVMSELENVKQILVKYSLAYRKEMTTCTSEISCSVVRYL